MIALLKLSFGGRQVPAALHDDGTWRCPNAPELELALSALFDPRDESGPEFGAFGVRQAQAAAERWNGKVVWQRPEEAGGRVY